MTGMVELAQKMEFVAMTNTTPNPLDFAKGMIEPKLPSQNKPWLPCI